MKKNDVTSLSDVSVLWQVISENETLKQCGVDDIRLIGINHSCGCDSGDGNKNTPATSFSPIKGVFHCKKCDKGGHFYDYVKSAGWKMPELTLCNEKKINTQKEKDLELGPKIYKNSKENPSLVRRYFSTRGLKLDDETIKYLGLRINTYKDKKSNTEKTSVILPLKDLAGTVKQTHQIFFDPKTGKKIGKKFQSKNRNSAVYKFNEGKENAIIFEGLEDALTHYLFTSRGKDVTHIVVFGAGKFKNATKHLDSYKKVIVVIDDDEKDASFKGTLKLPSHVNILRPTLKAKNGSKLDANGALMEGMDTLKEWIKTLTEVVRPPDFIEIKDTNNGVKVSFFEYEIIKFLNQNGFYRYDYNEKIFYVKIEDKFVEIINKVDLKDFVLNYLKNTMDFEYKSLVINEFQKKSPNIFQDLKVTSLEKKDITILKDSKDTCYTFFKNCYVETNRDGSIAKSYDELKSHVWKNQIIGHDFEYLEDDKEGVFESFVKNTSSYRLTDDPGDDEDDKAFNTDYTQRGDLFMNKSAYNAKRTALGYLLHDYKPPDNPKAIVCVDSEITDSQEGGTGKSLFGCRSVEQLKNVVEIDGKRFQGDSRFSMQGVDISTQVIVLDDITKRFSFNDLFSAISGSLQIEEKGQPRYTIPPKDSPKFVITSNSPLKGEGYSHERRQHIIEFTDFYRGTSVKEIHEHTFFSDWNKTEWNRFFTFCFKCLELYLKEGLKKTKSKNYEKNRLKMIVGEDLTNWLNDNIELDYKYIKKELFENIKVEIGKKDESSHRITKRLNAWCKFKWYELNPEQDGKRDVIYGIEYITIKKKKV